LLTTNQRASNCHLSLGQSSEFKSNAKVLHASDERADSAGECTDLDVAATAFCTVYSKLHIFSCVAYKTNNISFGITFRRPFYTREFFESVLAIRDCSVTCHVTNAFILRSLVYKPSIVVAFRTSIYQPKPHHLHLTNSQSRTNHILGSCFCGQGGLCQLHWRDITKRYQG
jgi:hypothetical protein